MMEWMLLPFRRYFQFSGRSRRKEYWMFVLFTVLANIVLGILDELLGLKFANSGSSVRDNGVLSGIFSLVTFIPSLSVGVRRLHDTDRTGWWLLFPVLVIIVAVAAGFALSDSTTVPGGFGVGFFLIGVIGLASFVVLLVFLCLDGTRGPNRFGDDPKGVHYEGVFD